MPGHKLISYSEKSVFVKGDTGQTLSSKDFRSTSSFCYMQTVSACFSEDVHVKKIIHNIRLPTTVCIILQNHTYNQPFIIRWPKCLHFALMYKRNIA